MLRRAQHERGDGVHTLACHPDTPAQAIRGVAVTISGGSLSFAVEGPSLRMPPPAPPMHTDGLWRTTCFELFVKPTAGETYFEFNFSPSTAWAAYRFGRYRGGMSMFPVAAPVIEPIEHGVRVTLDLSGLPLSPYRIGLSAVIEEVDGTKSYWALAHPDGPPDFHDPACFVLTLPASGAA